MGVSKCGLNSKVVFISREQNVEMLPKLPRWHLIELYKKNQSGEVKVVLIARWSPDQGGL